MNKAKILMVLTEFPPRIGGMQTHAVNLIKHLASRDYNIEVLTYQVGDPAESRAAKTTDQTLPCPVNRCLSRVGHVHNLSVIVSIGKRFQPDLLYTSTVFYGKAGCELGVPAIARSVGNDVMRPWVAYPFAFGSRLASHPLIDRRLYRWFRQFDYPELIESLFRRKRRELMKDSAKSYAGILANSEYTRGLLEEIGVQRERLEVVVGGVDHARFSEIQSNDSTRSKWLIPKGRFVIITVCRLVAKKGIDFLIQSMGTLKVHFPDIHLLVVGDGRKAKRLSRMARTSAASDRITFAGRLDHDAVEAAYSAADVFILASRVQVDARTGLQDAETMGRVLCEANSAGVPVIAARSGGIPSVICHGENGLLFEPDSTDSLVEQLARLRKDPELQASLIKRGRARAEAEFDWPVIIQEHETAFKRCLNPETGSYSHV